MPAELPLFAYGTLLTGALDPAIDRLLARDAVSLGPARLRGRLHDQGGYPGMLETGHGWIQGELLEFANPSRALAQLDHYEGYNPGRPRAGDFIRELRQVETGSVMRDAWVYVLNTHRVRPGPRISDGNWRRYRNLAVRQRT